jgi:N-acetylglucosamine kinase-like BadF-type ATPase
MTKLNAKAHAAGMTDKLARSQVFVLGIDGGGTRTTALLADERGRILGRGLAGPSNPVAVGLATARREILAAARQALDGFRPPGRPRLKAVCLGLAGADRLKISRPIAAWLRKRLPAAIHLVTTDAVLALEVAVGAGPGIVVIAGTGSIACARDAQGWLLRAGGWGSAFDDAGSGFDLGRQAVCAALRAFDGRGPKTSLGPMIARSLGLDDITGIVALGLDPPRMASLAPLVIEAARRGDAVARHLLDEAGRELAGLAVALIRRAGLERKRVSVACAGGLLRASTALRRSFARHLRRQAPGAQVRLLRREPVEGAVRLALRQTREWGRKALRPQRRFSLGLRGLASRKDIVSPPDAR